MEAEEFEVALAVLTLYNIDLVMISVNLPGSQGFELLVALQEEMPELPVLILNDDCDAEIAGICDGMGPHRCIQRPQAMSCLRMRARSVPAG